MATIIEAPKQYKQPSRKGKKAWRKHVDIEDLQEGLETVRDEEIKGGVIAEKSSDSLFQIDTSGSTEIQKTALKGRKPLKADEILAQRSAIPAVSSKKRPAPRTTDGIVPSKRHRSEGVSNKELERLKSIAYGGESVNKDVIERPEDASTHDPWAETPALQDPRFSYLEEKKPVREPATLKHAPLSLLSSGKPVPAVRKLEAGKSYNPVFEDWSAVIDREGQKEVEAERKRLEEARLHTEIEQRRLEAANEPDHESEGESAWESEWEGIQSEREEEEKELRKKRPERKTPAERNKIKRRKEEERRRKHEAKMKERAQQQERIKEFAKLVAEKEKQRKGQVVMETGSDVSSDGEEVIRRKRFGKIPVPEAPLEVVLADELQESLRLLKPEGNLMKDRYRTMMVRGKIEARKPITQPKKAKKTATEKWSYKDWKLK